MSVFTWVVLPVVSPRGPTIAGGAGNDSLQGTAASEVLAGGAGADTLVGGGGSDFYEVDSALDVVIDADSNDADTVLLLAALGTGIAPYSLPAFVENLAAAEELAGVVVSGNALDNWIGGGNGDDTLSGGAGNDTLRGGAGVDQLMGGPGNDRYEIDSPADGVVELPGEGQDTVSAAFAANARFEWLAGVEVFEAGTPGIGHGSADRMTVLGSPSADVLVARGPNILFDGGAGNDLLRAESGGSTLRGGDGNDTLSGAINDGGSVLEGGAGNDVLSGWAHVDTLYGGAGNDVLENQRGGRAWMEGGEGNDTLRGSFTAETLIGGPGADLLAGRGGGDTYVFTDLLDTIEPSFAGIDVMRVAVNGFKRTEQMQGMFSWINDALPLAYWVDALVGSHHPKPVGVAAEVSYAFSPAIEEDGVLAMDSSDRQSVREAFALWAAGTGLRVREVVLDAAAEPPADDTPNLVFAITDLSEIGAQGLTVPLTDPSLTVILIDQRGAGLLGADPIWQWVLLHEVGHGLGLKHPGNYNAADLPTAPPFLPASEDNTRNTLMSYSGPATEPGGPFITQISPFDRAAMQYLYGVAPTLAAGATPWSVATLLAGGPRWLEDASGEDTLSAAGMASELTLDLRAGGRSYLGHAEPALITQGAQFTVGYGSAVEHAVGGSGSDLIQGNEFDNRLEGGAGNDTLRGGMGHDSLIGGAGDDVLVDRLGNDWLQGGDGDDRFVFSFDNSPGSVRDAASRSTLDGGAGQDTLELRVALGGIDYAFIEAVDGLRTQMASAASSWSFALAGLAGSGIEQLVVRDEAGNLHANSQPRLSAAGYTVVIQEDTVYQGRLPRAIDLEGDALSYSAEQTPYGQWLVRADGSFTYTPRAEFSGQDMQYFRAADGQGNFASALLTFVVEAVDDAPRFTRAPSDLSAVVGLSLNAPLEFVNVIDVDTPQLSFTLGLADGGALPAWLSFDPTSFSVSGTPAAGDVGLLRLRLTATGGALSATQDFVLAVGNTAHAQPQPGPALQATEDTPFVGRIMATQADGLPLRYELLNAWDYDNVSLDADGTLRFTPRPDAWGRGQILVRVSDGQGGSHAYFQAVDVAPVNDLPVNTLALSPSPRIGSVMVLSGALVDPDGGGGYGGPYPGQWLRDGAVLRDVGPDERIGYLVTPDDAGSVLGYRVSYTDGLGNLNSASVLASAAVPAMALQQGGAGPDTLMSPPGEATRMWGGGGNDTLLGREYFDMLDGGAGNDLLRASQGGITVDGGDGFDVLMLSGFGGFYSIDMSAGLAGPTQPFGALPRTIRFTGVEGVVTSNTFDFVTGRDGPASRRDDTFRTMGGQDTLNGGTGIDTVEVPRRRAECQIGHDGDKLVLDALIDGYYSHYEMTSIERLRFDDQLLAFGPRALEIARIAFALWSPAIASSTYLFARGISFYDVGYSFAEAIDVALTFHADVPAQQFAEQLAANVPTGRSAADLLALMNANGGAGPGQAGRAFATQLLADDAVNLRHVELAGLPSQGIACDLVVDGNLIFAAMPA